MTKPVPRVYSIAPGGKFMPDLAQEIISGFPFADRHKVQPPLQQWSIFLPTRRSARLLGSLLFEASGQSALLLPAIKPIGDIDDELLSFDAHALEVKQAISKTGQVFLLLDVLTDWAVQNPQISIAREIQNSHSQSLNLAKSLLKLIDQIETEETGFKNLADAYDADLSEHRNSILSLLGLLNVELPQRLDNENLIGPSARRSLLIRLEAQRIATLKSKGPIIAAGSTGTIPATRALLKSIAYHEHGAVILPGLDLDMTEDDWQQIGFDHPQYALQLLIADMGITRDHVVSLGSANTPRNRLSAELMRPSATAEKWHTILKSRNAETKQAIEGLRIVAAPDRHIEARAIALIMREALETPHRTAALVTPDRDLAKRVAAELQRWNIAISDTAGEPLINHGLASLAALVLQAITSQFAVSDLLAVLSHANCTLGLERARHLQILRNLEIAVLRGYSSGHGIATLQHAFNRAHVARQRKARQHMLAALLQDDDWVEMARFVARAVALFEPLIADAAQSFDVQLEQFQNVLQTLAPDADWTSLENQAFADFLEELNHESHRLAACSLAALAMIVLPLLREQKFKPVGPSHPRLAIYGVLEARFMPTDVLILGGLNEGIWPSQPDPGPWLNRPMRHIFGMQQPEREIGVSAHDFVQALGYETVYLTFAQRIGGSPQIPSRWILRLQTMLEGANLEIAAVTDEKWVALAKHLDASASLSPQAMPRPMPPVATRPVRYSVTEVEKLIRDPYSIYAKRLLKLEPLPDLLREPDAALRGTLFHQALGEWNAAQPHALHDDSLVHLIAAGERAFKAFENDPEISRFWKNRFRRMAQFVNHHESELRPNVFQVFAELDGKIEFLIDGQPHVLSARADRIDLLNDGTAQILDYKSGEAPSSKQVVSGISPQLPLEAAILESGGFANFKNCSVSELLYIQISGRTPPGKITEIKPGKESNVSALASEQLAGFKTLLTRFRNLDHPYSPRLAIEREEELTDFDHLSRYLEWQLAGRR